MRKVREAREEVEAETVERARVWADAKAREKAEITRIDVKDREKVKTEAGATAREKEKVIATKRVAAEAGAETRVRVEAKANVRNGMWES